MIKVLGWVMVDHPHNITSDPIVCADWHRQLFRVAPLYYLSDTAKHKINNIVKDCCFQADDGENYFSLHRSILDVLLPLQGE
jgi:hypothetical protein